MIKKLILPLVFMTLVFAQAQNSCQPPSYSFNNKTNVSGSGGVGSIYRFNNVLTGINAIITIEKTQNASIDNSNMDNSGGYGIAWQPFVTFTSNRNNASDTSYIEFKIQFRSNNSADTLVKQNCMAMTIVDCDGTGSTNAYREMVKVSLPGSPMGIESSSISVYEDANWILFKSGATQFNNIDTANVAAMGQVNFPEGITTYYMRIGVVGPVSANTQRQFSFYFRSFAALTIPLPVYLTGLEANNIENGVRLNWMSTHEENFNRYEVFRSFNGAYFEKIGEIKGAGSLNQIKAYQYDDLLPEGLTNSKLFYKLRMVDNNEESLWSHIVVNDAIDRINNTSILFYPNPAQTTLNLQTDGIESPKHVIVTDIYGKRVFESDLDNAANGSYSFDISSYERGIYVMHITNTDNTTITGRFIKN
ncbi:MAG: T9SS type A sorting domain-containing protein [Bacteroidia bacterium]